MDDLLIFASGKTNKSILVPQADQADQFSGGGGPVIGFRHVQSDVKTTMIIRLRINNHSSLTA